MDNVKTILCVDDDKLSRCILQEFVRMLPSQYVAVEAENGKDCLELVRQHYVDLIVLDYHLGDIRGHEICEKISTESVNQNVPIIIVSMIDSQDIKKCCIDHNIINIRQKPYPYEQFEQDVGLIFGSN